jgi:hypothetical protein
MDARIESLTREGGEFLTDYVSTVVEAAGRFTLRLLDNVERLAYDVIEEGSKVVLAATDAFLPRDDR